MTDLAWMKTYIGTETSRTVGLTAEEFGAYERLRRYYWEHEGLPNDDRRLMRITGVDPDRWDEVRSSICHLFGDGWTLPHLDEERAAAGEKRARAVERSQKAAASRWNKNAPSNATRSAASNPTSNAQRMSEGMPEAVLEECPSASASDNIRYDERLVPTHAHARTREPDPDMPIDVPASDADGLAFLRRSGLGPKGIAQALPKLMGGRLYRDVLDQIAMQLGDA